MRRSQLAAFQVSIGEEGQSNTLERYITHIMDDKQRIALSHHWTIDDNTTEVQDATWIGTNRIHYQYSNHLGSAALETDASGNIISYEEYFPYGETSFMFGRTQKEVKLKEYRYTGKERDDSTGLYYHGARYYQPWVFRWMSADPAGPVDGPNLYAYVSGNPVRMNDPGGMAGEEPDLFREWVDENGQSNMEFGYSDEEFSTAGETRSEYDYTEMRETGRGGPASSDAPGHSSLDDFETIEYDPNYRFEESTESMPISPYIQVTYPDGTRKDINVETDFVDTPYCFDCIATEKGWEGINNRRSKELSFMSAPRLWEWKKYVENQKSVKDADTLVGGVEIAVIALSSVLSAFGISAGVPKPTGRTPAIQNRARYTSSSTVPRVSLRAPATRHNASSVTQKTVAKELNSVVEPGINVADDVAAINSGVAKRVGDKYIVNGRTYGFHDGTLYPISGSGIHQLNRPAFKALGVLNKFGHTEKASQILENMGISSENIAAALKVWRTYQ